MSANALEYAPIVFDRTFSERIRLLQGCGQLPPGFAVDLYNAYVVMPSGVLSINYSRKGDGKISATLYVPLDTTSFPGDMSFDAIVSRCSPFRPDMAVFTESNPGPWWRTAMVHYLEAEQALARALITTLSLLPDETTADIDMLRRRVAAAERFTIPEASISR